MTDRDATLELRDYESVKFELADLLRTIEATLPKEQLAPQERIRDLFARLAEDRFNLVVVGRFSRGKTSLMNAILGLDRLPTGILPLTSVITSVTYGSREEVCIEPRGHGLPFEIPMEALEEYITEHGNPGNARAVHLAKIALPAEILRRGFRFVDTPGLGSAIMENARTTQGFLPEADAVIIVSGYDGPLTDDELDLAHVLLERRRPLFLVLNKHDTVPESMRAQVRQYVCSRLEQSGIAGIPPIFSVSAREGLLAKQTGDAERLGASGVAELESALARFLIDERRGAFLVAMCDRIGEMLDASGADAPHSALAARLANLRGRLPQRAPRTEGEDPTLRMSGVSSQSAVRMMDCVLCARVSDVLFEFLRHYQHDLALQPAARERLAAAGGLCGPHLWLYASFASQRDLSLALTPLLKRLTAEMRRSLQSSAPSQESRVTSALPASAACVVCEIQSQAEHRAIAELADDCAERLRSPARDLPSLCMPHLRAVAHRAADRALVGALIWRQAEAAARLTEDLQRYVIKRDGIRRALTTEEETQSAQRALAFLAGRRNVMPERC